MKADRINRRTTTLITWAGVEILMPVSALTVARCVRLEVLRGRRRCHPAHPPHREFGSTFRSQLSGAWCRLWQNARDSA